MTLHQDLEYVHIINDALSFKAREYINGKL